MKHIAFLTFAAVLSCAPASAAVFVVNVPFDAPDSYTNDNLCDIQGNPSTNPPIPYANQCTLRAAIEQANAMPGSHTILLAPTLNVQVLSPLPWILSPVTISPVTGTMTITGPCTPTATITFAGTGNSGSALVLAGGNSTVRQLSIVGFKDGAAIRMQGMSGNKVYCNYLGVDLTGNPVPNANGVDVIASSTNAIGGGSPATRNVISGNDAMGIYLEYALGNKIQGNYIGSDVAGQQRLGNKLVGVWVNGGGFHTIGGPVAAAGNLIVANDGGGVLLSRTESNTVISNNIGEGPITGVDLGNGEYGVFIYDARSNEIGLATPGIATCGVAPSGTTTTTSSTTGSTTISSPSTGSTVGRVANPNAQRPPGNLISRNRGQGVIIQGVNSRGNSVRGNIIGLDATGTVAVGNTGTGVLITEGSDNFVGGSQPGSGNLISSNDGSGVYIFGDTAKNNRVQANWIGVDCTGKQARANQKIGVYIREGSENLVGGTRDAERNLISANGRGARYSGVYIHGVRAKKNRVEGNTIGMDRDGLSPLGNSGNGVTVDAGSDNDVGGINGSVVFRRNLISANDLTGVVLMGGAHHNRVRGNYIGTDATGAPAGSGSPAHAFIQLVGAWINDSPNNFIGDMDAKGGNVLSNHRAQGVLVTYPNAKGNFIWSNRIGTDESGTIAFPNQESGIGIIDAPSNFIGNRTNAPGKAPGNVISGSLARARVGAIHMTGPNAKDNQVRGNLIGVAADGVTPMPNGYDGVFITDRASDNRIGGELRQHGNVIAHNGREGVAVDTVPAGYSTGNSILSNRIFKNKKIGIDLGFDGPSPMTDRFEAGPIGSTAPGPNNWQRTTKIHLVGSGGGTGLLDADPNTTYRVQFFSNTEGDVTGYGQGEELLNFAPNRVYLDVTTDAEGFSRIPMPMGAAGKVLSATVTSPTGDTSEFAKLPCVGAPVDNALTASIAWKFATPPRVGAVTARGPTGIAVNVIKYQDQGPLTVSVTVDKTNRTPEDDLTKVFVRVTVENLALGRPVPESEVYQEYHPLDRNGKADLILDMSNILKSLGAPLNKNFIRAKLHACYRGKTNSVTATTSDLVHIVRDKVIVFLPGVLGSMMQVQDGSGSSWAYPVHWLSPIHPGARLLRTDAQGDPLNNATALTLFTDYRFFSVFGFNAPSIATVYDVDTALANARVTEQLPVLAIGGAVFTYYHIFPWAYDWRLKLEKDVDWLLDGQPFAPPRFDDYPSPPSITQILDVWARPQFPLESDYLDDRAALAGHSTGGLIIRSAFTGPRALQMRAKANRAYFINVPFLGAPKAYHAYLTGKMIETFIPKTQLMDFAPNMPIVYYLAPANGYRDPRFHDSVADGVNLAGGNVDGKRYPPPIKAATYMNDLIDTANGGTTHNHQWNSALADAADDFHFAMMSRDPVIGWHNTKTFYTDRNVRDTIGKVTVRGAAQIDKFNTDGDQTVPRGSQYAGVPERVRVDNANQVHQSAANNKTVWANIIRNLGVPNNINFTGYTPRSDHPNGAGPTTCVGPRASEQWGLREMGRLARNRNYKSIPGTWPPSPSFSQGLDQVYCDGIYVPSLKGTGYECHGTFVVGEAKGGYRGESLEEVLRYAYGFRQGTIEWAGNSAAFTLRLGNPSAINKARPYLQSLAAGVRTRMEVFHAECGGAPPGSPPPRTLYYHSDRYPY